MTDRDSLDEVQATADEARAAGRLASALEGDAQSGADAGALAVVALFQAVSAETGADEVAARRLRNELTARASEPRRPRALGRVAAVAALLAGVGALSVLFRQSPVRPSESVLAVRERAARAAVVAVTASWSGEDGSSQRIAEVSEQQWRARLVTQPESEHLDRLASEGSESTTAGSVGPPTRPTRTVPTPGGSS